MIEGNEMGFDEMKFDETDRLFKTGLLVIFSAAMAGILIVKSEQLVYTILLAAWWAMLTLLCGYGISRSK